MKIDKLINIYLKDVTEMLNKKKMTNYALKRLDNRVIVKIKKVKNIFSEETKCFNIYFKCCCDQGKNLSINYYSRDEKKWWAQDFNITSSSGLENTMQYIFDSKYLSSEQEIQYGKQEFTIRRIEN
jgi:hypothetical protein